MTDREKLVELIGKVQDEGMDYSDVVCAYSTSNERLADYLLSNGVTFATDNNAGNKWIPVTERLPDELPKDCCAWSERVRPSVDVLVKIDGVKELQTAWYSYSYKDWTDVREEHGFTGVTHWMPLPEPPKEE